MCFADLNPQLLAHFLVCQVGMAWCAYLQTLGVMGACVWMVACCVFVPQICDAVLCGAVFWVGLLDDDQREK